MLQRQVNVRTFNISDMLLVGRSVMALTAVHSTTYRFLARRLGCLFGKKHAHVARAHSYADSRGSVPPDVLVSVVGTAALQTKPRTILFRGVKTTLFA